MLKEDFEKDESGELGLRAKHYKVTPKKEVLLDGISLLGKTRDEIIALIGKPNRANVHMEGKRGMRKQEELYYSVAAEKNSQSLDLIIILSKDVVFQTLITGHKAD